MLDLEGVKFHWLGHDGYRIIAGSKTIYIDPYQLSPGQHNKNDADIVLISHNHFDHLSIEDLKHILSQKTAIVAANECIEQLANNFKNIQIKAIGPGDRLTVQGITIEALAAYNTNKHFHPKQDRKVGFIITSQDLRIYHTGDTDDIPEMSAAKPDVALVPVSGTYVMTADEAAKAVNEKIKPKKLAIPMHYGTIVGSNEDAAKFKQLVKVCPVQLLDKE